MKLKFLSVLVFLLSTFAMGQNPAKGSVPPQTPIRRIEIVLSSFDPSTSPQRVQLEFLNNSPAGITAWGYCVNAQKANENDPSQGVCTLIDAVPVVVDREVQERITLEANPADCPDCHFVHPGEHKTLSTNFSLPVVSANIEINLIAYSDGRVEISRQQGSSAWQQLSGGRQNLLRLTQEMIDIGKGILADPTNQHPTASMINELQDWVQNQPGMASYLRHFKRPEWRRGNNTEFIPDDERGYLSKFVSEQQLKVTELSKYQIRGVNQ